MRNLLTFLFCSVATLAWAQAGGRHAYDFLRLPAHARVSALGGVNVSLADKDVNFFHNNPALAGDTLNGFASAGYQLYLGGISHALFSYAHDLGKFGQLLTGIQHLRYGAIQGYDETGMETLEFSSGETAIVLGRTQQIGNFRLGALVKAMFSNIAGYRANALMMDLGGLFLHPSQDLTVGLVLKNMGVVLSEYTPTSSSKVPFDVQAGVSMKPQYMPMRFSLTAHHLLRYRLLSEDPLTGKKPSTLRNVFGHLNVGAEILLHRNVNVMVGYNYLLHQALRTYNSGLGAGFSLGFSLSVKPVELAVSRSGYTIGNAGYSFTLSADTKKILGKRKS